MRALILALLCGSVTTTWAATESTSAAGDSENKSSMGLEDVIKPKRFEEDKRITDLELRAQAGSLSRYSLKFDLGYSGSPVNQLSDPNRPNPDQRPGDNRTNLSGSISLRYRMNPDTAANFYTGVKWFTPYQAIKGEPVERRQGAKNYDVSNPGVSVDRTYAAGPTQMRSSVRASATTEDYYRSVGQVGAVGIGQSVKYTPFMGRLILGAQVVLDYFAYNRDYRAFENKANPGDGNVSKYYLNFIPSVEYKITSALNFNTSLGYPYQNMRADPSWWRWSHQLSTWRVGVGWAITHDVYINPYVNFFAESPAFNTASLNFNTVFSIF